MCFTQLLFLRKDVQAKKGKVNGILIISMKKQS